ncbi:hypothetical protein O0L34_g11531 [Tuta absoluta]|nr:hypothetical protein O0L34_g11531 [Tuta absoluta]
MSNCTRCTDALMDEDSLTCYRCQLNYHFACVGLPEDKFRRMRTNIRASWQGPCCASNAAAAATVSADGKMQLNPGPTPAQSPGARYEAYDAPQSQIPTGPTEVDRLLTLFKSELAQSRDVSKKELSDLKLDILNSIDDKFKAQEQKINKIYNSFHLIIEDLKMIKDRQDELEKSNKFISDKYEQLLKDTDKCKTEMKEIKKDVQKATLNKNNADIEDLKCKLNLCEQRARECNIEIFGIPEKNHEKLPNIILCITTLLGIQLSASDIVSAVRVPPKDKNNKLPKPIVAKMSSSLVRDQIISGIRKRKGSTCDEIGFTGNKSKIYINEHLTAENKHLFKLTRESCETLGFLRPWVRNGKIYMRKSEHGPAVIIQTKASLNQHVQVKTAAGKESRSSGLS